MCAPPTHVCFECVYSQTHLSTYMPNHTLTLSHIHARSTHVLNYTLTSSRCRSMVGNRDSEIAMVLDKDSEKVDSLMDGKPYRGMRGSRSHTPHIHTHSLSLSISLAHSHSISLFFRNVAGEFVHSLRVNLWKIHLGYKCTTKDLPLPSVDPISDEMFHGEWLVYLEFFFFFAVDNESSAHYACVRSKFSLSISFSLSLAYTYMHTYMYTYTYTHSHSMCRCVVCLLGWNVLLVTLVSLRVSSVRSPTTLSIVCVSSRRSFVARPSTCVHSCVCVCVCVFQLILVFFLCVCVIYTYIFVCVGWLVVFPSTGAFVV
jgi:hypothetical protein